MAFKFITAEEAAEFIHHNDNVGFSGFTAAGTPKVVSVALAKKAEAEHAAGRPFQIGVYTGASTSDYIDGALSRAKAIKSRTPYQSHKDSREAINNNEIAYFDLHLSHLAQTLRYGRSVYRWEFPDDRAGPMVDIYRACHAALWDHGGSTR